MRSLIPLSALLFCACSDYDIVDREEPVLAPESCPAFTPEDYAPNLTADCARDPEIGSFDPTVEWQWSSNPIDPPYDRVETPPVVFDINADGVPDLVFTAFTGTAYNGTGALIAVSGADQSTLFSTRSLGGRDVWGISGVAAAMIDGEPALFVAVDDGLARVNAAGEAVWVVDTPSSSGGRSAPAIGDVDGNGVPDIIMGGTLVDAHGQLRWSHPLDDGRAFGGSFPADLDGDGYQEIITGMGVLNARGQTVWIEDETFGGWPAVGDLDGDGAPEIVLGDSGKIVVRDTLGNQLWSATFPENGGGPPTVADFDGDGQAEIGIACKAFYRVYDGDGTMLWEQATQEQSSGITGSSVFDFEGDGAAEVVYADEGTLWVFDGSTGAVELEWDWHNSGTRFEYPTIADLDADGSAEIIVPHGRAKHGTDTRGISVIGSETSEWAPARAIWNQHAYHITNINDDGTVPSRPMASWEGWNNFRAAVSETPTGLGLPDLAIGPPERCTLNCNSDWLELWIPVENRGAATAEMVELAISTAFEDNEVLIQALSVPVVAAGEVSWAGPVQVHRDDFGPFGLTITAIPQVPFGTDGVMECDNTNNTWRYSAFPCDF